jgi:ubiquinone/menaquinone biosynthesis C-methylase UbiE
MASDIDYKRAAIDQWTADPCGSSVAIGAPGTREYFEGLTAARSRYAPWMADALDYDGAAGLDVLDVGCGQGIDLAQLAMAGARAVGIDLTPRHVELAREHLAALGLEAQVERGDAESLSFADESFDRVLSNGVLHHTPAIKAALREILRVLRPGGEARIIVYNKRSFHYWIDQVLAHGVIQGGIVREGGMSGVLARWVEHSTVGARPLVRVYTPRGARRMLESAGFVDVTTVVRHFHPDNTFVTQRVARRARWMRDPALHERLAHVGGWYVVARGVRPR